MIGLGGMGMLPLALFLVEGGAEVAGWDDALTPRAEEILRSAGVRLVNPEEERINCDFLVYSSAVRPDHAAFRSVVENGAACFRRGELLARIARDRRLIAVAGSHGKTSTTALIAWAARKAEIKMDHIIGGLPGQGLAPASNQGAEWLVAEVDESDGTIEGFHPEITLFINFDWDHADRYESREAINEAWARLASRTTALVIYPEGSDLVNGWSDGLPRIAFREGRDFRESNGAAALEVIRAVGHEETDLSLLGGFPGVWRRQTVHVREPRFAVLEDYAHHPAEVKALLGWIAAEQFPKPLRVFFQPHRFSRTTRFASEFVEVLKELETVGLHSIYGAGEKSDDDPLDGIGSALENGGVQVDRIEKLSDFDGFAEGESPSGTYAFVGAGDANDWAPVLAARATAHSSKEAFFRLATDRLGDDSAVLDAPVGPLTTLRVGGRAAVLVRPASIVSLRWLLRAASLLSLPVAFLGNGSNTLVADEGFDGVVILLRGSVWEEKGVLDGGRRVVAAAGVPLPTLARWTAGLGLEGFEFLEGIPGTVGGGLCMNAGSMGGWLGDLVETVDGIDPKGRPVRYCSDQLDFGYRSCPCLEAVCIIRAVFRSQTISNPDTIRAKMREFSSRRREHQPGGASAGCMFRNPDGDSAGRLIEAAGLKGIRVGDVTVSLKHANFVLPGKNATAADVTALMKRIRESVFKRFGIVLEPEVRSLGPGFRGCRFEGESGSSEAL